MDIENIYRLASKGADLLARGDDFAEALAVRDLIMVHRELAVLSRHGAGASVGYKLVPSDATVQMIQAGIDALGRAYPTTATWSDINNCFGAMVAAAPTLPEAAAQEGNNAEELHSNIMNIRVLEELESIEYTNTRAAHRHGHRDARHTAAELASAFLAAKQAQPVADLSMLTRYEPVSAHGGPLMRIVAEGDWYSVEDVQAALATHPQPTTDRWDADQIADACIAAEIPDSKYESLMIALSQGHEGCWKCGEDGGTSCGDPKCGLMYAEPDEVNGAPSDGQIYAEVSRRADPEAYDAAIKELESAFAPLASSADGVPEWMVDRVIVAAGGIVWLMSKGREAQAEKHVRELLSEILATPAAAAAVELPHITDTQIKECIDSIDFSKMVTADDLFYMIARAVLALAVQAGEGKA